MDYSIYRVFGWRCHVNSPHWDSRVNQSWFWQIFLAALLKECCTGVFLWCMISWFFAWNMNLRNYSLWAVTWRFCVTLEELKILTNISLFHYSILRDFEMRVLRMFRVLIKSDLDMRFTIWSLDVALFVFLQLHNITQRFSIICWHVTCIRCNYVDAMKCRGGSRIFFRRGAPLRNGETVWWLDVNTSVLESRRSCQGGAHPLHSPLDPPLHRASLWVRLGRKQNTSVSSHYEVHIMH